MRYFLTLSYRGTEYSGWQRQPNGPTIQACLEEAAGTMLRSKVTIIGCGRTDAGVHARYYVAHFETDVELPQFFIAGMNHLLSADIAVHACSPVDPSAHARFDAFERGYIYTITRRKNPFLTETAWHYPQATRLNRDLLDRTAELFLRYDAFKPFCKSGSGLAHFRCQLMEARWEETGDLLLFHVRANRFLRGMVRLMVGASVQVAMGKLALDAVQAALDEQTPIRAIHSVPPQGLALTSVRYPYSF
jgi:tRNA pseudouridine38-40 synthase